MEGSIGDLLRNTTLEEFLLAAEKVSQDQKKEEEEEKRRQEGTHEFPYIAIHLKTIKSYSSESHQSGGLLSPAGAVVGPLRKLSGRLLFNSGRKSSSPAESNHEAP